MKIKPPSQLLSSDIQSGCWKTLDMKYVGIFLGAGMKLSLLIECYDYLFGPV
jgi:hypothetical protein